MWRRSVSQAVRSRSRGGTGSPPRDRNQAVMDRGLPREQAEMEARRLFGSRALILEATREVRGFAGIRPLLAGPSLCRPRAAPRTRIHRGGGALAGARHRRHHRGLQHRRHHLPAPAAVPGCGATRLGGHPLPQHRTPSSFPRRITWPGAATTGRSSNSPPPRPASAAPWSWAGPNPAEVRAAPRFGQLPGSLRHRSRGSAAPSHAQEELPNGPKAVLLTDQFWRDHFQCAARRPGLEPSHSTGSPTPSSAFCRQSFVYPVDVKIDLLTTLPVSPTASHRDRSMSTWAVFGRLKPGVTMAQARADLDTLFAASRGRFPADVSRR